MLFLLCRNYRAFDRDVMTATVKAEKVETLGKVLVQVQDDLRQLRRNIDKIAINGGGEKLDLQALDNAIHRTECGIQKHAEQCLKAVNSQMLVLPIIESKKPNSQIPKWRPPLENIPNVYSHRGNQDRFSPGEKHKAALTMRLLYNPAHPQNRAIMHQKFGIPLPEVHKKSVTASLQAAQHQRVILSSVSGQQQQQQHQGDSHLARSERGGLRTGMPSVLDKDPPSPGTGVCVLQTLVQHKAASLHGRGEQTFSLSTSMTGDRPVRRRKQLTWSGPPGPSGPPRGRAGRDVGSPNLSALAPTPPASAASRRSDPRSTEGQSEDHRTPRSPQALPAVAPPAVVSRFPLTIADGRIDPTAADFCRFKEHFCQLWGPLVDALHALQRLLRQFAVPLALVNGERLAECGRGWCVGWASTTPPATALLSALDNRSEVWALLLRPGQRYRGEGGVEAAAVRIQACWRGYRARAAYLRHRRRRWAADVLAGCWLMRARMRRIREALQASRRRHLENQRQRAQHLAANWKHIQSSKRTIIHIPSLGYSKSQRLHLKDFDILQNAQIGRLADVRDENVDVIYVSPLPLGEDMAGYYARLLEFQGPVRGTEGDSGSTHHNRFTIVTPEALDYFPTHSMCLSTLLKYSPRTLRRIRTLVQGRRAYVVGGVAHPDDLAVADQLGVAVLGPEPAVARLYGTKSGGRRIFAGAGVAVPPGHGDIYSLDQLHETLAGLMVQNMEVRRWLFKMDSEFGGRGTAYCDVGHLSCYGLALQEYQRLGPELWSREEHVVHKYAEEIPAWLACYAQPAHASCFPDWACFLETFLRQGGVVEAYPPSASVTCLTVDLLLEPGAGTGGEAVSVLSYGDQLHGACRLQTLGSRVPQASVRPDALRALCLRVGRACLERGIMGHVSVDLATFLDPSTGRQKVWAIDLDLGYSDQLAMTQLLLVVTGATLDCRSCRLLVPVPTQEKSPEAEMQQSPAKHAVGPRYAVLANRLRHTNLSIFYHNVFFSMCKAHGIGYDTKRKEGTVFVLHDSSERHSIGMLTVCEDLRGSLVTFARNLSVIHQEISSPKTQGDTNFKDLLKDIEDVLKMTAQNKVLALEDESSEEDLSH